LISSHYCHYAIGLVDIAISYTAINITHCHYAAIGLDISLIIAIASCIITLAAIAMPLPPLLPFSHWHYAVAIITRYYITVSLHIIGYYYYCWYIITGWCYARFMMLIVYAISLLPCLPLATVDWSLHEPQIRWWPLLPQRQAITLRSSYYCCHYIAIAAISCYAAMGHYITASYCIDTLRRLIHITHYALILATYCCCWLIDKYWPATAFAAFRWCFLRWYATLLLPDYAINSSAAVTMPLATFSPCHTIRWPLIFHATPDYFHW